MYRTSDGEVVGKFEDKGASKSFDITYDSEYIVATFSGCGVSVFKCETGDKVASIEYEGSEMAKYVEFAYGDKDFVVYTYFKDNHKIKLYDFKSVLQSKAGPKHYKEILLSNEFAPT
jgi:hypothetical protein